MPGPQTIGVPFVVTPVAPAGEQKAPGWTVPADPPAEPDPPASDPPPEPDPPEVEPPEPDEPPVPDPPEPLPPPLPVDEPLPPPVFPPPPGSAGRAVGCGVGLGAVGAGGSVWFCGAWVGAGGSGAVVAGGVSAGVGVAVGVGSGAGVGVAVGVRPADGPVVAATGAGVGAVVAGWGPTSAPSHTRLQNAATTVLMSLRQSGRGRQVQAIAKAATGKTRKLAACTPRRCHQGRSGGTAGGWEGGGGGGGGYTGEPGPSRGGDVANPHTVYRSHKETFRIVRNRIRNVTSDCPGLSVRQLPMGSDAVWLSDCRSCGTTGELTSNQEDSDEGSDPSRATTAARHRTGLGHHRSRRRRGTAD
ncbi:hypothetical protein GCM10010502_28300 [Kitasatospora aureofaciens]|uniref:Uncharacterized protein n=1 Tax=Kitasatospora aureofaciens TaxID=1894 RepID=A0A8H9HMX4_KITAU|nr:hypothetical protein GCM10010502_28300 [Kitasatospora aureofaciens]